MSNYPPPPPFGGPFNSTAHFTQSMSSNLPGIPQFPYGSLQKSFPPAGGALDAPYANAYYFDKNRQEIINTPNTITNAGFPSTTMDEIPNTAVSQSHAEPITYSSHPVSRETPHFTQHSTSAPSNTQHSDPQHRLGLANQIEAAMSPDTALPASAAAISDLEDGELSDDNGGEHSKVPSPGATSHDRVTVIPTELHSHGRHEYPGAVRHTAVVTAPAQRKGKNLVHHKSPPSSGRVDNSMSVDNDKRKQAKEALWLLHEHGLDYVHLVGEGIDSVLLEGLYAEMGIQISSRDSLAARGISQKRAEESNNDEPREVQPAMSLKLGHIERLGPKINGDLPSDLPSTAFGVIDGTSKIALSANGIITAERVPNGAQPGRPAAQQVSNTVPHDHTSNNRSSNTSIKTGDKGYDRKDHIARMLAARAGKTASTANTSALLSPASALKSNIVQELNSKYSSSVSLAEAKLPDFDSPQQKSSENVVASNLGRRSETIVTSSVAKQSTGNNLSCPREVTPSSPRVEDFQAKKKAQTELARRKMEALMSRNSTKTQEEAVSQLVQPPAPTPNLLPTPATFMPSHKPSPAIVIPTASQAPPTSRSSFFSPTPGRQFNLPGLFMPSASAVAKALDADNKDSATQLKQAILLTSSSQQVPTETTPQATLPSGPPKLSAHKGPAEMYMSEVARAVSPTNENMEKSRKRPKAADFIDPPATRVKRPFGQNGDKSVVIEVSEDEALGGSLDDVVVDVDTDQNTHEVGQLKINGSRKIQQLVVSDAQLQKRSVTVTNPQTSTGANTPQVIQIYGKDSGGLKSKEMEIEVMKRRIAEVEQRRRAKQSSSRAQTPNTSKYSSPPKQSRASSEIPENSRVGSGSGHTSAIVEVVDQAEGKEGAALAGEKEPIDQERLLAEQLGLEAEPQPADKVDQYSRLGSDPKEHQQERPEIAKHPDRDRSELRHVGPFRTQISDEQPLRDLEDRQAMPNEEENQRRFEGEHARKDLPQSQGEDTRTIADEKILPAVAGACSEQLKQRRTAINTEVPILDAEICRIEQDLQQLRNKINDLDNELHHLAESRRKLVEELRELSPEAEVLPRTHEAKADSNSVRHMDGNSNIGSLTATTFIGAISSMPDVETSVPSAFDFTAPATPAAPNVRPGSSSLSTSDGELEEDVMDISKSDLDEGEISEYAPQSIQSVAQSVEAEDAYEPPNNIDVKKTPPGLLSDFRRSQQQSGGNTVDHVGPSISKPQDGTEDQTSHQIPEMSESATLSTNFSEQAETLDTKPIQSTSSNKTDESDDYEPPEPVSPSESAGLEKETVTVNDQLAHDILATATERQPTPVMEPEVPITTRATTSPIHPPPERIYAKKERKLGHFVPYESPLKQFKSYRYHRNFPIDVAKGFRSLTYSNDIDPEQPICPFEIGGTCNDQTCPYQHFRNMGLSDNMILLQLGFAPEGLSPADQLAYSQGLKNLIRDIRSRNVRDFNAMAADITTYRANFIGDATKVLPL